MRVKRLSVHPSAFIVLLALIATGAAAQTVRITEKPQGLVSGTLHVPVVATAPVERLELVINGVPWTSTPGQRMTAQVNVGYYIRRLRMREKISVANHTRSNRPYGIVNGSVKSGVRHSRISGRGTFRSSKSQR